MRGKGELRLAEIVFSWVLLQGFLKAKVLVFSWGVEKSKVSGRGGPEKTSFTRIYLGIYLDKSQ